MDYQYWLLFWSSRSKSNHSEPNIVILIYTDCFSLTFLDVPKRKFNITLYSYDNIVNTNAKK